MKSKHVSVAAIGVVCLLTGSVAAQTSVPQFSDYAVNERFNGKTAPLVFTKEAKVFRTRLREAAREKPNFAGHFIVTAWGCGSGCVEGAIIDARTGRIFMLPHSLCCWGAVDDNFKPIEFRPNSRLIVLTGARNEKEGDNAVRFYKFENNRLILLSSKPAPN